MYNNSFIVKMLFIAPKLKRNEIVFNTRLLIVFRSILEVFRCEIACGRKEFKFEVV